MIDIKSYFLQFNTIMRFYTYLETSKKCRDSIIETNLRFKYLSILIFIVDCYHYEL